MKRGRKFVLKENAKGEPFFSLVAPNGEIIFSVEGYGSEQAMRDTLETLVGKIMPTKIVDSRLKP